MSSSEGRTFVRTVGGKEIDIPVGPTLLTMTGDVDADAGKVAANMGLVGELLAETTEALERADAAYRKWRGVRVSSVLVDDPKLAEWKVKAQVEADDGFESYKGAVAELEGDLAYLRAYFDGLRALGRMVEVRQRLAANKLTAERVGVDVRDATPDDDEDDPPRRRRGRGTTDDTKSRADRVREARKRGRTSDRS